VVYENEGLELTNGMRSNQVINTSSDIDVEQSELSPMMVSNKNNLAVVQKEIANLYLKIKRCSKDISITES
jgi:hypothetical protein